MSVTKAELADLIYKSIGFSKKVTTEIVDTFFDLIKSDIIRGEKVKIKGIGTFYTRTKKERIGRNPQTDKPLMISARKVVVYRAGTSLKKLLKETKIDTASTDDRV